MTGGLITLCAAVLVSTGSGTAATGSTVVTAEVPSAVSIMNRCTAPAAYQLGVVAPGTPALTATDASVCGIEFSSSNDSAMLRASQADATGAAMTTAPTAWQRMRVDDGMVNAISMAPGSSTGWAVGEKGLLLRTTDGGASWSPHACTPCGTGKLHDVSAASTSAVFVASTSGRIYRFDGTSWSLLTLVSPSSNVNSISAVDANTVWAAGNDGYVWRSTDASAATVSWTTFRPTTVSLNGIDAVDADVAFAVGNSGVVVRGTGGGSTWDTGAAGASVRAVAATSATSAVVVTSGGSAYTTVDGLSWTIRATGSKSILSDVERVGSAVYAVDELGTVVSSGDGGVSWQAPVQTRAAGGLAGVAMSSASTVIVGGHGGNMLRSTDSGVGWDFVRLGTPTLVSVAAVDGAEAFAVGDAGAIHRTTDGGASWSPLTVPTSETLRGIATTGTSGDRLIAVGDGGTVLTSTDSGVTWTSRSSGTTQRLRAVTMVDAHVAWAVGDGGTVLRSSNGGISWTSQPSGVTAPLYGVAAASADVAWAAGGSGSGSGTRIILGTTNAGAAWTSQFSATGGGAVMGISAASTTAAFAVGLDGRVYRTSNGSGWTDASIASGRLFAIDAVSPSIVYVAGYNHFGRSVDGAATWQRGTGPSYDALYAIGGVDADTAFATGGGSVSISPTLGVPVSDYGASPNDWAAGSSSTDSLFGICLQAVGAGTTAAWAADAAGTPGRCEASDADPWRAVPTAPSKVATAAAGTTGRADVVFGLRAGTTQAPGVYYATVTFEALAPNV